LTGLETSGTVHGLRAAEYLKAKPKGNYPSGIHFVKFDPKPFVFVSNVAVFGKSRTEAPSGADDGSDVTPKPNLGLKPL
jgi:hypothetical protein